jgi:hypothetical protein
MGLYLYFSIQYWGTEYVISVTSYKNCHSILGVTSGQAQLVETELLY